MTWSTYGPGYSATLSTDIGLVVRPRGWTGGPAVIYVHGWGQEVGFYDNGAFPDGGIWSTSSPNERALIHSMVDAGYIVGLAAFGGPYVSPANAGGRSTWGFYPNGFAGGVSDLIDDMRDHLIALGADNAAIPLASFSMGFINSCRYAKDFPAKVSLISSIAGIASIDHTRLAGVGFLDDINTAAGGTYVPATHDQLVDPTTLAANGDLDGIPIRIHYSANDNNTEVSIYEAFAAVADDCWLTSLGNVGHGDATIGAGAGRVMADLAAVA